MGIEWHVDLPARAAIVCIDGAVRDPDYDAVNQRYVAKPTMFSEPLSARAFDGGDSALPTAILQRCEYLSHHNGANTWQTIAGVIQLFRLAGAAQLSDRGHPVVDAACKISADLGYESHKLKAYLRFRKNRSDGDYEFTAFHSCEHNVLPLVAPFMVDRFKAMTWKISTKWSTAVWSGRKLTWLPGESAPSESSDEMDDLWQEFYRSTYNPDRLNPKLFKHHVPQKYWQDMPEIRIVGEMMSRISAEGSSVSLAQDPSEIDSIANLQQALARCRDCELADHATQAVPGSGPADARVMIVGEQPGDLEDQSGEPFVGPAGQLLRQLCQQAGLNIETCYLTNAVKHFRYTTNGKQRIHKRATVKQASACRKWLVQEIALVQPEIILCLGTSALNGVMGTPQSLGATIGQNLRLPNGTRVVAAYHPAAILRADQPHSRQERESILLAALAQIGCEFG